LVRSLDQTATGPSENKGKETSHISKGMIVYIATGLAIAAIMLALTVWYRRRPAQRGHVIGDSCWQFFFLIDFFFSLLSAFPYICWNFIPLSKKIADISLFIISRTPCFQSSSRCHARGDYA
jgi:hypothetical protein